MRIRTIKPEFWRSDDIDALSIEDRLLFIGLWSYVDDSGVGIDKESSIAADLFAGDLARDFMETSLRVQGGLKRLHAAGLIERYEADGRRFIHVVRFPKHQKINRPTESRYPPPTSGNIIPPDPSPTPHGGLSEDSLRARKEPGNRGYGEQGNRGVPGQLPDSTPDRARNVADRLNATAHSATAHRLVEAYAATSNRRPTVKVLSRLGVEVDGLLDEQWPEPDIARAITTWGSKGLGPGALHAVAHEVVNRPTLAAVNGQRVPTTTARYQAALAHLRPEDEP